MKKTSKIIRIVLPDGAVKRFTQGVTGLDIAQHMSASGAEPFLGCSVNGHMRALTAAIEEDASIHFYNWDDPEGKQIFWHSSAHLLAAALELLYPHIQLGIGPPIEQGFYYDVDLGPYAPASLNLEAIEKQMLVLAQRKDAFVRKQVSKAEAIDFFRKKNNPYKLELIEDLEDGSITFYQQGNFVDLCKGPHLPHTGYIQAAKILNISGAYWRGNERNPQLTRLYAITFPTQDALASFMVMQEEAKKRSHQKISKELGLFTFSEKVGVGLPLWLPKGAILYDTLVQFLKKEQMKQGYLPVVTPHIGHKALYMTSGHYEKYQDDCFQPIRTAEEGEEYMLKPMNCPHHCEIYNSELRSYQGLPLRLAEFGTVYRYELSGALHGLARTRCFTQDDAHIFRTNEQVRQEFARAIDLVLYVLNVFHFTNYTARLAFREPKSEKDIGDVSNWDKAEQVILEVVQEKGFQTSIAKGEAAFYGPKVDFVVKDALGRSWQLGTIQLDYQLPIRFDLTYISSGGEKLRPVMIHRAPFGSLERFIAILIEHTGGKFPFWLSPEQTVVLSLSDKYSDHVMAIHQQLLDHGIRATYDIRSETMGKKIREAVIRKVPYILVIGEKEIQAGKVSVRKHGSSVQTAMGIQDLLQEMCAENRV